MSEEQGFCCPHCHERYDCVDHLPKMLSSCGHGLCKQCLTALGGPDSSFDSILCVVCKSHSSGANNNFALCEVLQEIEGQRKAPRCTKHHRSMELWCKDCECFSCSTCLLENHLGHDVEDYENAKSYEDVLTTANLAVSKMERTCEKLAKRLQNIKNQQKTCVEEINNFHDKVVLLIGEKREQVLNQLEGMASEDTKSIKAEAEKLEGERNALYDAKQTLHRLFVITQETKEEVLKKREETLKLLKGAWAQFSGRQGREGLCFEMEKDVSLLTEQISVVEVSRERDIDATRTIAQGSALVLIRPFCSQTFVILAHDADGVRKRWGEDVFEVFVNGRSDLAKVKDLDNGSYEVALALKVEDLGFEEQESVEVRVLHQGACISGSPFQVPVCAFRCRGRHLESIGDPGNREGELREPGEVVIDGDRLYIADGGNNRIQVLALADGAHISCYGQQGEGDGCLNGPFGLCVDEENLYVFEKLNMRVSVLKKDTGEFVRLIGAGILGQTQGGGVDGNRVYVADSSNRRVVVFDKHTGDVMMQLGVQATTAVTGGVSPGNLNEPINVAFDDKCVYVSDRSAARIQVYDKGTGAYVRRVGRSGVGEGEMQQSNRICIHDDMLFAPDRYGRKVVVFQKDSGDYLRHFGHDVIKRPSSVRVAKDGRRIYVSDFLMHKIHVFE